MKDKYYAELFTLNNVIIYGYAAVIDIAETDWNMKRIKVKNKVNIIKYTAVINEEGLEELKKCLQENTLRIAKNEIETRLNKDELLSEINAIFGDDKTNENIETIDEKLKEELWFAFNKNIEKLGSFEICSAESERDFFKALKENDAEEAKIAEATEEMNNNILKSIEDKIKDKEHFEMQEEVIKLYKSIRQLDNKKLAVLEEIADEKNISNFKDIIEDNKVEICRFFTEGCSNGNLESFKAISLLMYMSSAFNDEVVEKYEQYGLSLDSIRNYLQIILGNDGVSKRTEVYSALKEKLEKCCNRNPITESDFEWTKKMFNHPIKSSDVDNEFVLGFLQLLRKRSPEKLIDLVIDVKGPLVYTEFMVYLHQNWNEEIFKELLKSNITTFKELAFAYAYNNVKNQSTKEEKMKFINTMMTMIDRADSNEFSAFILGMLSDEECSEERDEIKNYLLDTLVNSIDENSNMKRILLLLKCNDNKKNIFNIYEIGEKITFENLKVQINKEIMSLVKDLSADEFKQIDDINEIRKILLIAAHSRLQLKNNMLTVRDLKEELIINNYRVLSNPYLRKINYHKWNETLNKFIINIVYKSQLLNQYDGNDKAAILNTIIDEFYIAVIALRQSEDEGCLSAFRIIGSIFNGWVEEGYVDSEMKNKIYSITPEWKDI